jgi:ADP-ribose pyrophosphatase YjhB (NUDIX family)
METPRQILPAVAAAIFNDKGEVLLQKRKDVNKWCIISGHVEFGETIEEAILREIEEETNSKASIVRLIGVYSSPSSQTYHYLDRTETMELKFFKPGHLPENFALINAYWLIDALNKKQKAFVR